MDATVRARLKAARERALRRLVTCPEKPARV